MQALTLNAIKTGCLALVPMLASLFAGAAARWALVVACLFMFSACVQLIVSISFSCRRSLEDDRVRAAARRYTEQLEDERCRIRVRDWQDMRRAIELSRVPSMHFHLSGPVTWADGVRTDSGPLVSCQDRDCEEPWA